MCAPGSSVENDLLIDLRSYLLLELTQAFPVVCSALAQLSPGVHLPKQKEEVPKPGSQRPNFIFLTFILARWGSWTQAIPLGVAAGN